jgi:hypothetical protein
MLKIRIITVDGALYLWIQRAVSRQPFVIRHMLIGFFLTMNDNTTCQNIDDPS